jgi:hypothetical protein
MNKAQVVAFMFKPGDSIWFYAAAYNSPYILWIDDDDGFDIADIQREIITHWQELPRRLSETYGSPRLAVIRSVRAVWDDPEWLENIVPNLIDPNHRLSVLQEGAICLGKSIKEMGRLMSMRRLRRHHGGGSRLAIPACGRTRHSCRLSR